MRPLRLRGRDALLETFAARVAEAVEGAGGLIALEAPPGTGKSRLLDEFAAASGPLRTARGRWLEGAADSPLGPWPELLRALGDAQPLPADLAACAAGAPPPDDLAERVAVYLREAATAAPLLLLFDDAHLADELALDLLLAAGDAATSAPLLLVVAHRPPDPTATGVARRLEALGAGARALHVDLSPLPEPVARELLSEVAPALPPPVVRTLLRRCDGIPFFIIEYGRVLSDPAGPSAAVPDGVRALLARRLLPLDDRARGVLQVASVFGREFRLDLLAAATGLPVDDVTAAIAAAEARSLVQGAGAPGRYRFDHALTAEALYASLPASRRLERHRDAAEAIRAGYGEAAMPWAELARHAREAVPLEPPSSAVEALRRAAEEARRDFAYERAGRLYGEAVRLVDEYGVEDANLPALLVGLGNALIRTARRDEARSILARAADVARATGAADVLVGAGVAHFGVTTRAGYRDEATIAILESALDALRPGEDLLRLTASVTLAVASYEIGDLERTERLASDAWTIAEASGDRHLLAFAGLARSMPLLGPGRHRERLRVASEMLAHAEGAGDPEWHVYARGFRWTTMLEAGDREGFEREVDAADAEVRAIDVPQFRWQMASMRVGRALMDGDWPAAERARESAAPLRGRINAKEIREDDAALALASWEWLDGDVVDAALQPAAALYPGTPYWSLARAVVALREGDDGPARRLRDAADLDLEHWPRHYQWLPAAALVAELARRLGDVDLGAAAGEALSPFEGFLVALTHAGAPLSSVSRALGDAFDASGATVEARRAYERALDAERAAGWPAIAARTACTLAELLSREGDAEHAVALAAEAADVASRLRMPRLQHDAATLSARLGSGSRATLTERERGMLPLLAGGMTNQEIGTALGIAPATVARHLANLYPKLGVRSRTEAAAYALRYHLDPP